MSDEEALVTHEAPGRQEAMQRSLGRGGEASPGLPSVRFVADLTCPWCYIGFARLMRLEGRPFRLAWHPFLLNPHLPAEGVPRSLYVERKFGSSGMGDALHRRAAAAAAAEGLEIRPERIRRQPSTVGAHALLLAAGEQAASLAMSLFDAFFRDGEDLGSEAMLAALARRHGLKLPGPAGRTAVEAAHAAACAAGVDGVPLFMFGEDHAIAGAQPAVCLEALLDLARYRLTLAGGAEGRG